MKFCLAILLLGACISQCLGSTCCDGVTFSDATCTKVKCTEALTLPGTTTGHQNLVQFLDACRAAHSYAFVEQLMKCVAPSMNRKHYMELAFGNPKSPTPGANVGALVVGYGCVDQAQTATCKSDAMRNTLRPQNGNAIQGIEQNVTADGFRASLNLHDVLVPCISADLPDVGQSEWTNGMSSCAASGRLSEYALTTIPSGQSGNPPTCSLLPTFDENGELSTAAQPFCQAFFGTSTIGVRCTRPNAADEIARAAYTRVLSDGIISDTVTVTITQKNSPNCTAYLKELACQTVLAPVTRTAGGPQLVKPCSETCRNRLQQCGVTLSAATNACTALGARSCPSSGTEGETSEVSRRRRQAESNRNNAYRNVLCSNRVYQLGDELKMIMQAYFHKVCGSFASSTCTLLSLSNTTNPENPACLHNITVVLAPPANTEVATEAQLRSTVSALTLPAGASLMVTPVTLPQAGSTSNNGSGTSQLVFASWLLALSTVFAGILS